MHMYIYNIVLEITLLLARLFQQYDLNEIPDKHKNKLMWRSYFFIFRRLKNNVPCFFIKKIL